MSHVIVDHDLSSRAPGDGLLDRLGRRKGSFAVGFLLTFSVVAGAFTALQETYRTSAALMVSGNEAVLRDGSSSAEAQRLGDPADVESQMLMLRSPRLARIILADPAVREALIADCEATRKGTWLTRLIAQAMPPAGCSPVEMDTQRMLRRLEAGFAIGPTGRSRVIDVAFVSSVPKTSVTVANALVDTYLRDDKERKVDTHDNAINWLTSEVAQSGEALRRAELEVEAYRSEHGIIRGQQASISSERLSALSQQLAMAQAVLAQATSRTRSGLDAETPEVLASRSVADLKQQSAEVGTRYAELRQRMGDNHPSVRAVAEQKREIDGRISAETRRIRDSLQRDAQSAVARVAELQSQYDRMARDVGRTGGAEAGIAIMVRDVEARREIYVEQLKKVNVLQTERRLLSGDARLVNHAELPERPWFPKKLPFIAIGTVLATVAGAGLSMARDRGDQTLRATTQMGALAGIPIMGYVPRVRRVGIEFPRLLLDNASPLQEAIRAIFGRFVLVPGNAPKTLMVCSADQGEGKTFLSLSLALFAASTGRRVLVIEADLRRPTFRKSLDLLKRNGLSEYLRGDVQIRDIVGDYHGLHMICAGTPSTDSTELLSKRQFDQLLQQAETRYDLIVIDSPPAMALMDAHVMARRVSGIVFCASLGRSRPSRVVQAMQDLEGSGGTVLGLVVSGTRPSEKMEYDLPGARLTYGVSRA